MENVDEFVRKDWIYPKTLKGQQEYYKELNERIEVLLLKKKYYDDLINQNSMNENNESFSFKEQWELYSIVKNLILKNSHSSRDYTYLGIDLLSLKEKLQNTFKDVGNYIKIISELNSLKDEKNQILSENITFNVFEYCTNEHCFVRMNDELRCIYCGATTKDYPLNKDEFEFLTLCAEYQGILLKEFTNEDLPLLKVLIEKQNYYRSLRKELDPESYDYLDQVEEQWLEDEEIPELRRKIKKAHLLDSQTYDNKELKITNPKYLSNEKSKELLLNVEKEYEKIQKIDSRFKDLMIEECKTARYEILILSGAHIPSLLKQAINENDKIALTKAYYNISTQSFRINSEYFAPNEREWDALTYDCVTANPEINNRILQMKLRRN